VSASFAAPPLCCPSCRVQDRDVRLMRGGTPDKGWPDGKVPYEALRCPECDWQGVAVEHLGSGKMI